MSGQNPREIALHLLQRRGSQAFIEDLLDSELRQTRLSGLDRRLCQELVYGVVRWQAPLDWLIAQKTDPARAQKPLLQNILRLGLYQIFFLDRIPQHAAVHESVELAKRRGLTSQSGFLNAVLRSFLREFELTKARLAELKNTDPAIGYSHPQWLVDRWQQRWSKETAAQLMNWNNIPPQTFARVNTLKTQPGPLLEQWRAENVEYDFFSREWVEENLVFELKEHPPLAELPSFKQGLFYIQDPGTLLAVRALGPQPGETVLDLCAAPGGKLTYLAQVMGDQGLIIAHDLNASRLQLIQDNCARLGLKSVRTALPAELEGGVTQSIPAQFDRILVDAPCSNTGVMRRRVELRWRIRPEELVRLRATQLELLNQAVKRLKPGGTLVYSTCSLEPEENEQVASELLERCPKLVQSRARELTPMADRVDGAFVAGFTAER